MLVVAGAKSDTTVEIATLAVAAVAVLLNAVSIYLIRKTGRESSSAASISADAAQRAVKVAAETAMLTARRADADALSARYSQATAQLGHDQAAVRLAGVYAMARLADDWVQQRQACVDLLCTYLRLPWPSDDASEAPVRLAIAQLLELHLNDNGSFPSWSDLTFDFRDADLRRFRLSQAVFANDVLFDGARFGGGCRFSWVNFGSQASFDDVKCTARCTSQAQPAAACRCMRASIGATCSWPAAPSWYSR
jgi:hypothetical protein